jgi:hypothetical protein
MQAKWYTHYMHALNLLTAREPSIINIQSATNLHTSLYIWEASHEEPTFLNCPQKPEEIIEFLAIK